MTSNQIKLSLNNCGGDWILKWTAFINAFDYDVTVHNLFLKAKYVNYVPNGCNFNGGCKSMHVLLVQLFTEEIKIFSLEE